MMALRILGPMLIAKLMKRRKKKPVAPQPQEIDSRTSDRLE